MFRRQLKASENEGKIEPVSEGITGLHNSTNQLQHQKLLLLDSWDGHLGTDLCFPTVSKKTLARKCIRNKTCYNSLIALPIPTEKTTITTLYQ